MFSKSESKGEGVKDIIKSISSPDELVGLEKDLKEKSDDEIVELVKQDLLDTDATIVDRINRQKTGARTTSNDPFVRGLSFYLFNILDDEKVQDKFLTDLKQLGKIKPLQSIIESVQKHIEEYKECAKKPRPPLQGPVSGRF